MQRIFMSNCFQEVSRFNVDAIMLERPLSHYWTSPLSSNDQQTSELESWKYSSQIHT